MVVGREVYPFAVLRHQAALTVGDRLPLWPDYAVSDSLADQLRCSFAIGQCAVASLRDHVPRSWSRHTRHSMPCTSRVRTVGAALRGRPELNSISRYTTYRRF